MKVMKRSTYFIVSSLVMFLSYETIAQTKLNRAKWEELRSTTSFKKPDTKNEMNQRPTEGKREVSNRPVNESPQITISPVVVTAIKFLFIGATICLIIFLIIKLLTGDLSRKNTRIRDQKDLSTIGNLEAIPEESDLERWLREAKEANDFTMMIRIYFIMMIRELDDKGRITWKKEKTNRDYILELEGQEYQSVFKKATMMYEESWFGNRQFDPEMLKQHVIMMEEAKKKINVFK